MRLKKSEWKGFILPVEYTSSEYYDVKIKADTSGFTAVFERKAFSVPVKHSPEAYDYPDRLFAPIGRALRLTGSSTKALLRAQ